MATGTRRRWTGAATVPSSLGWAQIGWFMAVAELGEQSLVLRVRPGFIRLMFGIENLTVWPGDGAVIYPARAMARSGIEIRMSGRSSYYFWPGDRGDLLASLASAGFQVSAE